MERSPFLVLIKQLEVGVVLVLHLFCVEHFRYLINGYSRCGHGSVTRCAHQHQSHTNFPLDVTDERRKLSNLTVAVSTAMRFSRSTLVARNPSASVRSDAF